MDIDWIHRPSTPDGADGTLNLCFNALDRHVVHGRADNLALRVDRLAAARGEWTYARLLEEAAAFGGVLRACGVGAGERVLSRLPMGAEGLVAALAAARLGAVLVQSEPYDDPVAPLSTYRPAVVLGEAFDRSLTDVLATIDAPPGAAIWTGRPPEGHDLEWSVLMRAGRTDPAPCAEVGLDAPAYVVGDRSLTVADTLADDSGAWPLDPLAVLLDGGLVLLSLP